MSKRDTKNIFNRTGAFSLSQKRHLRGVIDSIYADGATDQMAAPGTGATSGTGSIVKHSVIENGDIITTEIMIDLTGMHSATTDLDIIGAVGAASCNLGQITAAVNGTIFTATVTCHETPATGVTDIDIYGATVGTGTEDTGIALLVETALHTNGGAWAAAVATPKSFSTALPAANTFLYLTCGAAGTVGTYTAGKFVITLQGYRA
jgi:hypothetical protein